MNEANEFKDFPRSVSEIRADRSENASDWTPRDAVISFLRRMDSGEIKPDALVICAREMTQDGATKPFFSVSSRDPHVTIGMLIDTSRKVMGG